MNTYDNTLSRIFDYINDDHKYADILPEFNRNNIKNMPIYLAILMIL